MMKPNRHPLRLVPRAALLALALCAGLAAAEPPRWVDHAHGHEHAYPAPGWVVRTAPPHARVVVWGGVPYRYAGGAWYVPGRGGFVVARPPVGIVIGDLPPFYTVVTLGGIAYWYANGVYYREHPGGGYEVAEPPAPANAPAPDKVYVYPRNGQTAEQQSRDEYDCHRWAVGQTGFDPTQQVTGQAPTTGQPAQGEAYQRAQGACLEGRGYTVR